MELDTETQRLVLAVCGIVTVAILAVDFSLWKWIGNHATISGGCVYMFERWPVAFAMLLIWIGVVVGHVLPAR